MADIEPDKVEMFTAVLKAAGAPALPVVARLDVAELGKLGPGLLVCDIDRLEVDPLEMLRQLRFVLQPCIIVVYTEHSWGLACHVAGANGVLSKDSSEVELASGVRGALVNGCFTDPRFKAA
ncbi:MAG: hypothetical protein NVSMB64_06400 [Candidatus Velthaea sp.]